MSGADDGVEVAVELLVVCSANRCRSPLAAALLEREAGLYGLPLKTRSAGFAEAGLPATSATLVVAHRHGLDLSRHSSTWADTGMVEEADLVIAMERAHVREIVVADPAAWDRTFTLKELVRRAEAVGPRAPGEALAAWIARVGEGRERRDLLGASPTDDVPDPTTNPRVDHESVFEQLEALVEGLLRLAWPARESARG